MEEKKDLLMKSAMSYGLGMGIFWVIKYLFLVFRYSTPTLIFIYQMLCFAVPVVAYYMTKQYRQDIGGSISFSHAWRFGLMLYFFAALIVSVEHYVFYQYIAPPDFLSNMMNQAVVALQEAKMDSEVINSINQTNFTPIHMTIQGIFNNIFYGIILSIPVATLVSRKKAVQTPTE